MNCKALNVYYVTLYRQCAEQGLEHPLATFSPMLAVSLTWAVEA